MDRATVRAVEHLRLRRSCSRSRRWANWSRRGYRPITRAADRVRPPLTTPTRTRPPTPTCRRTRRTRPTRRRLCPSRRSRVGLLPSRNRSRSTGSSSSSTQITRHRPSTFPLPSLYARPLPNTSARADGTGSRVWTTPMPTRPHRLPQPQLQKRRTPR